MKVAVKLEELRVSYSKELVLEDITLSIAEGEKVGIIGPNGAGKSTLIKAMMGLIDFEGGIVEILGASIEENRKKVAYIPQQEEIDWDFPISVQEVVMMGRYVHLGPIKRARAEDRQVVEESLKDLGIWEYRERQLAKLSGGQKQRVFLARALAQEAQILLLDEPFAGIDQTTQQTIYNLLEDISARGKTIIVVNHDLQKVEEYFEKLILINQRLIAYGATEAVFNTQNLSQAFRVQVASPEKGLVMIG